MEFWAGFGALFVFQSPREFQVSHFKDWFWFVHIAFVSKWLSMLKSLIFCLIYYIMWGVLPLRIGISMRNLRSLWSLVVIKCNASRCFERYIATTSQILFSELRIGSFPWYPHCCIRWWISSSGERGTIYRHYSQIHSTPEI